MKHYSPPSSEVLQSYCFFTRVRQLGEMVSTSVAELQRIAEIATLGKHWNSTLETVLSLALTMMPSRRSYLTSLVLANRL